MAKQYKCITKTYFRRRLWNIGEIAEYGKDIVGNRYFKPIESNLPKEPENLTPPPVNIPASLPEEDSANGNTPDDAVPNKPLEKDNVITTEDDALIREQAKLLGIGNWHNKKIENLKSEIEEKMKSEK